MNNPEFLDKNNEPVSLKRVREELELYSSDILRGSISPSLSFLEYVQRYSRWTCHQCLSAGGESYEG